MQSEAGLGTRGLGSYDAAGPPFFHARLVLRRRSFSLPVLAAISLRSQRSSTAEHPAHHARHRPRGSDGVSRVDARADASARRVRARVPTVFTRAYAQAPVTTVSHATHPVRHLSAVPSRQRFRRCRCRGPCRICPSFSQRRRLSNGGVRRIADPRSARRDGARIRSRLRRLRRRASGCGGRATIATRRSNGAATRSSRARCAWIIRPAGVRTRLVPLGAPLRSRTTRTIRPADLKARFAASPYDGEIAAVDRLGRPSH